MKKSNSTTKQLWVSALLLIVLLSTSAYASAQQNPSDQAAASGSGLNIGSIAAVVGAIAFGIIAAIVLGLALTRKGWLSQALSESDPLRDKNKQVIIIDKKGTVFVGDPTTGKLPDQVPDGALIYPRSASRLIAFIGLFAIVVWEIITMIPALGSFAHTGKMPDLSGLSKFLVAQAGIFTPYIANKVVSAFKS
jgi:hypothetical protein